MTSTAPYHHGDLSEALVVEALRQVRELGSEAVSLRGVAQTVGVSASAAYHHFPDKAALMHEVGNRGSLELDLRTLQAADTVRGKGKRAAVARLHACAAAYIAFASEEPNLFRHTFGAYCAHPMAPGEDLTKDSRAYQTLGLSLDELDRLGMLRPGSRAGLDLLAWTSVHGFASLLIEGIVPPEAAEPLLGSLLGVMLAPGERGQ